MQRLITPPDASKNSGVAVAPNPSSGTEKIMWNITSFAPVEVRIADAAGLLRKSFTIRNNVNGQFDISVADLPNGLYIIFLTQGKEQASIKLLVNKN